MWLAPGHGAVTKVTSASRIPPTPHPYLLVFRPSLRLMRDIASITGTHPREAASIPR